MRKIKSFLLCAIACFAFSSCKNKEGQTPKDNITDISEINGKVFYRYNYYLQNKIVEVPGYDLPETIEFSDFYNSKESYTWQYIFVKENNFYFADIVSEFKDSKVIFSKKETKIDFWIINGRYCTEFAEFIFDEECIYFGNETQLFVTEDYIQKNNLSVYTIDDYILDLEAHTLVNMAFDNITVVLDIINAISGLDSFVILPDYLEVEFQNKKYKIDIKYLLINDLINGAYNPSIPSEILLLDGNKVTLKTDNPLQYVLSMELSYGNITIEKYITGRLNA